MGKTRIHNVNPGEVWTAYYPYKEGFAKKRPVLVLGYVDHAHVRVQRISRKKKFGSKRVLSPATLRGSWLHDETAVIEILSFRTLICKPNWNDPFRVSNEAVPYPEWFKEENNERE